MTNADPGSGPNHAPDDHYDWLDEPEQPPIDGGMVAIGIILGAFSGAFGMGLLIWLWQTLVPPLNWVWSIWGPMP